MNMRIDAHIPSDKMRLWRFLSIYMKQEDIKELIRENGFRVTSARTDVLKFLSAQERPVGVDSVAKKFPSINLTTLYRMMDAFVEVGLVETHDLGHGHVDYEFAHRPHHHHAVCESCGFVEDVFPCETDCRFEKAVLQATTNFEKFHKQSTTFFGTCKRCI